MIKLAAVNVKRFALIKDEYVDAMTAYFLFITHQPKSVIEAHFSWLFNRVTGQKWELRNHHFREIRLMPEEKKIGFLWYRTYKQGLFSDIAALQWISTDEKDDLKKYINVVLESLIVELKEMGIKRLTTEVFGSDTEFAKVLEDNGFEPVRMIMHKRLD